MAVHCLETHQDQLSVTIHRLDKVPGLFWAALGHEIMERWVNDPNLIFVLRDNNK